MIRVDRTGAVPELYLYGEIAAPSWYMDAGDTVSAQDVVDVLAELINQPEIVVRINSPGGDVFEGVAIYQALARFAGKVRVEVDALAASAASLIAMAGDTIVVAGNAMLMIHRAWTYASGNAEEMAKVVDSLRKVDESLVSTYEARVGGKSTRADIEAWLSAETWMTASEAVTRGFADEAGALKPGVEAAVPAGRFKNTPRQWLRSGAQRQPAKPPEKPAPEARSPVGAIAARIQQVRQRIG